MALYTHSARNSGTVSGDATWELISAATERLRIREIGIFMAAATASVFGLGRPAAMGVTPTSPVTVQANDPGDPAGTAQTAVAWATKPTAPTSSIYLRRIGLPAAIGAGVIWSWPPGGELIVPISSSIVLYNLATNGVVDIYVTLDE